MKRKQSQILTAVLVDYDNIYLALRRKSEEAAKRFAKDAGAWLREVELGSLITPTNSNFADTPRRIVLNRCYGNPVPRRNTHDNSTDMFSFPFVRHHFLRSGFEVVDCPPLTAQLKNSSDIRMVMDVRDFLQHDTRFDEFIILSGDADFTPVLHRLRAHARRTVIFANDHTAIPYKAISDGEIRETDLIAQLLSFDRTKEVSSDRAKEVAAPTAAAPLPAANRDSQRQAIIAEAMAAISASSHPIPIDLLAERVIRVLGHESTIATGWAGAGSFRELLMRGLPDGVRIGEQPPYLVRDTRRQQQQQAASARLELRAEVTEPALPPLTSSASLPPPAADLLPQPPAPIPQMQAAPQPTYAATPTPAVSEGFAGHFRSPLPSMPVAQREPEPAFNWPTAEPQYNPQQAAFPQAALQPAVRQPMLPEPVADTAPSLPRFMPDARMQDGRPQHPLHQPQPQISAPPPAPLRAPVPQAPPPIAASAAPDVATASSLQQSIARIHDACQAPPLSPPEYRILFDAMAREIGERGLAGSQTLASIVQRAAQEGVDVRRDDVRFVLEVVSETDPWFEQGASASLFAGRFRNFVVARCRSQGLNLSADELDLIEAWFVAGAQPATAAPRPAAPSYAQPPSAAGQSSAGGQADWRTQELPGRPTPGSASAQQLQLSHPGQFEEEFPRIVRTRLRG